MNTYNVTVKTTFTTKNFDGLKAKDAEEAVRTIAAEIPVHGATVTVEQL